MTTSSPWRAVRLAALTGTPLVLVGLLLVGEARFIGPLLFLCGAALWSANRRIGPPSDAASYDRQLRREAIGIALVGVAPIPLIVAVATGVIGAEKPAVVYALGPVMSACCAFLLFQVSRYNRAGGGGSEAVAIWNRDGLDAVKAHNARLKAEEELRTAIERCEAEQRG